MSNKFFSGKLGKGYYIALILCAVAIGVSGYMFYRNSQEQKTLQNEPSQSLEIPNEDVEAVATQPEQETPTQGTKPPVQTIPSRGKVLSPVSGNMALDYSMDALCYNPTTRDWRTHDGIDIAAEAGTQVCAAADGTVYTVYEDETMGTVVVIRHVGGYTTQYASLAQEVQVSPGDSVKLGQVIGCVGQTALLESAIGDHVHFSVACDGESVDPGEFLSLE